ncbi:hypothetical protein CYLTODRAFT_490659 [Cylindrobasidium torrendii FP15055 ss-10]|uniref:Pal1-domain-containing protein n=1 Tax=Cylindrobasidium torrendii FP15055 ss-10 TaxID=1314674 RepID=A0A0D7BB31_9AGAR|nr:hypothetical protein CYLTODRAFT_490659 [Cylindrobasidium torrendii FP15055 ss-10]
MSRRQRGPPSRPSSPSMTPPLSASTSNSNTSASPPYPTTPRRQSRYPELGRGTPRRTDTSHTYDRLEDLLRDAGYKETRVFTPESERMPPAPGPQKTLRPVGSVVNFISGLTSLGRSSSLREKEPRPRSTTPSRSNTFTHKPKQSSLPEDSPKQVHPSRHMFYNYSNDSFTSARSQPNLSRRNLPQPSPLIQPQPSRATAYLRHMASVSSMPARPSSTPAHQLTFNHQHLNAARFQEHDPAHPPLPQTWLQTVAQAVMHGGIGYVGGPQQPAEAVQSDTRGRRTDRQSLRPPDLVSRMSSRRAGRSESEVSRTRVVCHSAPGSRANSSTREDRNPNKKRKDASKSVVPSLAKTRVEDEQEWAQKPGQPSTRNPVQWGLGGIVDDVSDDDDDSDLDLRQILFPAKRQNSIRSLRKHLPELSAPQPRSGLISRVASGLSTTDYGQWDGYEDHPRPEPGRRRSVEDDDDESGLRSRGSLNGRSRSRRGLPTVWS